ncbi:MAG: hypothetical protein F4103_01815 [Boseongicola sp. SB0673_bin_14]|nr:hypothetical protein [Boseongicola sp. SB0667_bin_21]MYI67534.1 hypothetical protein [Boseongicola sp. SB0673_bin_14]
MSNLGFAAFVFTACRGRARPAARSGPGRLTFGTALARETEDERGRYWRPRGLSLACAAEFGGGLDRLGLDEARFDVEDATFLALDWSRTGSNVPLYARRALSVRIGLERAFLPLGQGSSAGRHSPAGCDRRCARSLRSGCRAGSPTGSRSARHRGLGFLGRPRPGTRGVRSSLRSPAFLIFPLFPAVAGASCWLGPFLVAGDGHGNDGMLMLHGNVFGIARAGESGASLRDRAALPR